MGYIKDYLKENKNKSFSELHFTEVDAAILALLILFDVGSCVPKVGEKGITFYEAFKKQIELHGLNGFGLIISSAITRTLNEARTSPRYKNLILCDGSQTLDENLETQSTFMSVILPNKTRLVICGSTDDTIVGWKENLNLLYNGHVPCLENAKNYLDMVGQKSNNLIVIGHSKGGMESLYATAFCSRDVFKKIQKAYSFDGTGYNIDIISDPLFSESLSKMVLFVPNSGIVGRIFYNPVEPLIVPSKYRGVNQHDLLSWEIKGTKFKRIKKDGPHLFPVHRNKSRVTFCKNVTVLASLVALICYMPLKSKIFICHLKPPYADEKLGGVAGELPRRKGSDQRSGREGEDFPLLKIIFQPHTHCHRLLVSFLVLQAYLPHMLNHKLPAFSLVHRHHMQKQVYLPVFQLRKMFHKQSLCLPEPSFHSNLKDS